MEQMPSARAGCACLPRGGAGRGNLHVRFDEGEGGQRSLALCLSSRGPLSTLLQSVVEDSYLPNSDLLSGYEIADGGSRSVATVSRAFEPDRQWRRRPVATPRYGTAPSASRNASMMAG